MRLSTEISRCTVPSLEALMIRIAEDGELTFCIYPNGVFDEDAFLLQGKLSLLWRWGLVREELAGSSEDASLPLHEEWLRYSLTEKGLAAFAGPKVEHDQRAAA